MKMKLAATVLLGVSLSLGQAVVPTQLGSVAQANEVYNQNVTNVNWDKGADSDITVIGMGVPSDKYFGARANLMARRAAMVDAQRLIAEQMYGVQVDAETLVSDLATADDTVKTKVAGLVKGAKIVKEGANPDGSYYVVMRVPMFGETGSLASVVLPKIMTNATPEPIAEVCEDDTVLPKKEFKQAAKLHYTGVVVDASGLGLEPTFSPVIYDVNGRAIYGAKNIDKDFAISQGMVEYSDAVANATSGSTRAGDNPLVVKAIGVRGGGNSVNNVNVIVSIEDGDRILLANQNSGMLTGCKVVFVK